MAKERKLKKEFDKENGNKLIITELVTSTEMNFDFTKYPATIQEKLGPFGLNIKLGNAASGLSGQDAVNAIKATHESMMKGEWHRGHAGIGVSKDEIKSKLDDLPEKEKARALKLLETLGVTM